MSRPTAPSLAAILLSLVLPACAPVAAPYVVTASDGSTHALLAADPAWKEAATASAAADIPCAAASLAFVDLIAPHVNEYGQTLSGRATIEGCGQRVSYDLVSDERFSSHSCVLAGRVPLVGQ